jgi:transcription-repair coupling factor (superfamily II helicase)
VKITGLPTLQNAFNLLKIHFQGASDAQIQWTILHAVLVNKKSVIVVPAHKDISEWTHFFGSHAVLLAEQKIQASVLPFVSMWGNDRFVNPTLSKRQRLQSLYLMSQDHRPSIVITTPLGLAQMTQTRENYTRFTQTIEVSQEVDQETLIRHLEIAGYRSSTIVDEEGLYSVRGSIFDIFPPNDSTPTRIEFLGDSIKSIRSFEIEDQKSRKHLQQVTIPPADETIVPDEALKDSMTSYFPINLLQMLIATDLWMSS